jgi:hypothetical protein
VFGFLADRLLDVSTPTAEAQTRISLTDLQAQIAALQAQIAALQTRVTVLESGAAIDASQITSGTLDAARLPDNVDASTLGGFAPYEFLTRPDAEAMYLSRWGGELWGPLTVWGPISGDGTMLTGVDATYLRGRPISNVAPAFGQALKWDGSSWVPIP